MWLLDMENIGIGSPSTIWKGSLTECTWTIHPTIVINGLKENRRREKPKKIAGPSVQGMVKNQLEIVEVWKSSFFPHRCSLNLHWLCNVPVWHNKNNWNIQPVKLGVQDKAQPRKLSQMIYYFICFPLFLLFRMAKKVPGLTKYTFKQVILPYQMKISAQDGEILLDISTGHYGWLYSVLYKSHL